jgi:hypothetical protein
MPDIDLHRAVVVQYFWARRADPARRSPLDTPVQQLATIPVHDDDRQLTHLPNLRNLPNLCSPEKILQRAIEPVGVPMITPRKDLSQHVGSIHYFSL